MNTPIHVCILAAGQSTRMKSAISKMLHMLCGKPLVRLVVDAAKGVEPADIGVVVGFQREQVTSALQGQNVQFVHQEQQLGTAHAVGEYLKTSPSAEGLLLVMNGDTPLITTGLLRSLVSFHQDGHAAITLATTEIPSPHGYGRIVRGSGVRIVKVVEEVDASEKEKQIREINAGIYLFDIRLLRELLPQVKADNKKKEYYLPDVVHLALQRGARVIPFPAPSQEVLGINNRVELAYAERIMRQRINDQWMINGVTMHDPERTYIDTDVTIGQDTILHPNVCLEGSTVIGSRVTIRSNSRITNSKIGDDCQVQDNCVIDSGELDTGVQIGPFARVRPQTYLSKNVHIGNFVELKKTTVGEGSKANHLSYLGDATIGSGVNVGAGTITCNYDGVHKHPTVIEDGVFVGSDTQFIAPVKIGKRAYIAAGSSITEDVPEGALAIARGRQVNKEGWVEQNKKKK